MRPPVVIIINLLLSGDIETNPGPFWKKEEDPVDNLQNIIDEQADEISDLKETVEKQSDSIADLKTKVDELTVKSNELNFDTEKNKEEIRKVGRALDGEKKTNAKVFEELSDHDSKIGQELIQQKETMNEALTDLVRDINKFRSLLTETREKTENSEEEVMSRLTSMRRTVEELKEKTWKLDTSTRNNLVFYGIKEEAGSGNTEWAVKEVIRSQLHISRDMPFVKVVRNTEEDAKGIKPVTVQFEKTTDRNSVLQKAKMLKGTNILISEDFPKDVMQKRSHLINFAKEVRKRRPDTRLNLQYDKLYVNNVAYVFNEDTAEIEMLNQPDVEEYQSVMKTPGPRRKKTVYATPKSKRRGRLSKSLSSDSPLHMLSSPMKNGYSGDPMLEAALDEDSDTLGDSLDDLIITKH